MNNFDLEKTLSTMVICVDSREKPTAEAKKRWGTVESTKRFFECILKAWRDFKKWEDKELVNIATFWIE